MLELKEASHKESKFIKTYERWKEQVKTTCTKLKEECSDQDLCSMMDAVEYLKTQVKDADENVRSHSASSEIRRKMDSCMAVMTDFDGANESMHEGSGTRV